MTRVLNFKPAARQSDLRLPDVPLGDSFITRRPVRHRLASIGRQLLALVWAFVFLVLFAPIAIGVLVLMRREFEYEEVDRCDLCSDPSTGYLDGHLRGEVCPRQLQAQCADCVCVVDLDRFGFCASGGRLHVIANRKPKSKSLRKEADTMKN